MKSDLVAQLNILGNSCNSLKSNMATAVEGKSYMFSIIKLDSCAIPYFRTNLTSGIHFGHYLCDPRSKSRSNVNFVPEYAVFCGDAYDII